jgi:hypothetical protein
LLEGSDGTIWAGTTDALFKSIPGSAAGQVQGFQNYGLSNGLSNDVITALGEHRDGNLWLGSETGGAMKIARGGMRNYGEADGLRDPNFGALLQDRAGHVMAITGAAGKSFLQRFNGVGFTASCVIQWSYHVVHAYTKTTRRAIIETHVCKNLQVKPFYDCLS